MGHFEKFNKARQIDYIAEAKLKFEESLKPLTGQLLQLFDKDDFENREVAIKALAKRCGRLYHIWIDELGAPEREAAGLLAGEEWIKGLSAHAYEAIKARNPSFKG